MTTVLKGGGHKIDANKYETNVPGEGAVDDRNTTESQMANYT